MDGAGFNLDGLNFNFTNVSVTLYQHTAALAVTVVNNSVLSNIHVDGDFTPVGGGVGGVVTRLLSGSTLSDCSYDGNIVVSFSCGFYYFGNTNKGHTSGVVKDAIGAGTSIT